jgi:hypothetical protein
MDSGFAATDTGLAILNGAKDNPEGIASAEEADGTFKIEAKTGDVTADQAANKKTTHPTMMTRIGTRNPRFFFALLFGLDA